MYLQILELGPSRPVSSPIHYDEFEHAQPNSVLFIIYSCIISQLISMYNTENFSKETCLQICMLFGFANFLQTNTILRVTQMICWNTQPRSPPPSMLIFTITSSCPKNAHTTLNSGEEETAEVVISPPQLPAVA